MAQMATEDIMQLIAGSTQQDERLFVLFDSKAVEDEEASRREGRPIFHDVDYIRIGQPGDASNIVHRPITDCGFRGQTCAQKRDGKHVPCDLHRFPRAYAAYKGGLDQHAATGTPLSAWPVLSKAQVEELKHFRVHTVEQLAELADSAIQNIGPIQSLKQQAKAFIEAAKGGQPIARLAAELNERDEQIAALQQAMKEQAAKIDALLAARTQVPPAPPAPAVDQKPAHKR